jgi:hypothetical protein
MTKDETIRAMTQAREAHELQMQKIEDAINGRDIHNPTTLNKTACEFGQWLYDENNHMQEIIGSQFYFALDKEHEQWHSEYAKIYKILFDDKKKKGLFSKLLGRKSIDPMELDKVKLYFADLQETTKRLLQALGSAQRRVTALPETKYH